MLLLNHVSEISVKDIQLFLELIYEFPENFVPLCKLALHIAMIAFTAYQGCYENDVIPSQQAAYTAVSGHNLFSCIQYCKGLEMKTAAYGATTCQCLEEVQGE